MKIVKSINNNYAIAVDDCNNKLIVHGVGVGFGKVPRIVENITVIDHSYYDVDEQYVSMINDIDEKVIQVCSKIVDYIRDHLECGYNPNLVFVLSDHVNFSIKKLKKHMSFKIPIVNDIEHLYPKEYEIGKIAVKYINRQLSIYLPKEEASFIALHIIEAEEKQRDDDKYFEDDELIEQIVVVIEKEMKVQINRDSVNYSRFVTHMYYLLKRGRTKHLIDSDNSKIYQTMQKEHKNACKCAKTINTYLNKTINIDLTEEEQLYLILHINRMCTREK